MKKDKCMYVERHFKTARKQYKNNYRLGTELLHRTKKFIKNLRKIKTFMDYELDTKYYFSR